jgi:hypothetical protein
MRQLDTNIDRELLINNNKMNLFGKSSLLHETQINKPLIQNKPQSTTNEIFVKVDDKDRVLIKQTQKIKQPSLIDAIKNKNKLDSKLFRIRDELSKDKKLLEMLKNNMNKDNYSRKLKNKSERGHDNSEKLNDMMTNYDDDIQEHHVHTTSNNSLLLPFIPIHNNSNVKNPIVIINDPPNKSIYEADEKEEEEQLKSNVVHKEDKHEENIPHVEELSEEHDPNEEEPVLYDEYGAVVVNEDNPQTKIVDGDYEQIFSEDFTKYPNIQYDFQNSGRFEQKPDFVNFSEIDSLIELLNSISGIFTGYFELMPKEEEVETVEKGNEKDMLEKTADVLKFYKKIRDFVDIIINNRKQLLEDIKYLQSRVDKLKASEEDMLIFYGLEHQYYKTKMGAALYEKDDPKFANYFISIHNITMDFETDLKKLISECYNLWRFNDFFQTVVDEIMSTSQTTNVMIILEKVDKILMLLLRIYEFKEEITLTINNSKEALSKVKKYRFDIEKILFEVDKLVQYYKTDLPNILANQNKGFLSFSSTLVVFSTTFLLVI